MDIESLGFNIGKNDTVGRPKFDPRDLLKCMCMDILMG